MNDNSATICDRCSNTGLVPCDNCGGIDDHICDLDGEEYGPYLCEWSKCPRVKG